MQRRYALCFCRFIEIFLVTPAIFLFNSGDRLPWLRQQDNHAPLKSLDWQLHCYGDVQLDLLAWCERINLPIHFFLPERPFRPETLCLVRPDGHTGWIGHSSDLAELTRYLAQWRIA